MSKTVIDEDIITQITNYIAADQSSEIAYYVGQIMRGIEVNVPSALEGAVTKDLIGIAGMDLGIAETSLITQFAEVFPYIGEAYALVMVGNAIFTDEMEFEYKLRGIKTPEQKLKEEQDKKSLEYKRRSEEIAEGSGLIDFNDRGGRYIPGDGDGINVIEIETTPTETDPLLNDTGIIHRGPAQNPIFTPDEDDENTPFFDVKQPANPRSSTGRVPVGLPGLLGVGALISGALTGYIGGRLVQNPEFFIPKNDPPPPQQDPNAPNAPNGKPIYKIPETQPMDPDHHPTTQTTQPTQPQPTYSGFTTTKIQFNKSTLRPEFQIGNPKDLLRDSKEQIINDNVFWDQFGRNNENNQQYDNPLYRGLLVEAGIRFSNNTHTFINQYISDELLYIDPEFKEYKTIKTGNLNLDTNENMNDFIKYVNTDQEIIFMNQIGDDKSVGRFIPFNINPFEDNLYTDFVNTSFQTEKNAFAVEMFDNDIYRGIQ